MVFASVFLFNRLNFFWERMSTNVHPTTSRMNFRFFLVLVILLPINIMAKEISKRKAVTTRVLTPPVIDGYLDDEAWNGVISEKGFYQFEPFNGRKPSLETEVKTLFDDDAIYISAMLFDHQPDSIYRILGPRDSWLSTNSDIFTVLIGPYNDGINMVEFMVSAAGVQSDGKHSGNHTDGNWNAVWDSEVQLLDNGWSVEMKIPYSALRFPKKDIQVWGIHFFRHIQRYKEWDSWNYTNSKIQGFVNQAGELHGIKNIKPPVRLSLTPYVSAYLEHSAETGFGKRFNGGMDLKYGLNESFTLDMTLIPDFGQVQSDDKILNLSPFEVRYNEKRSFFTEGTELFNKGGIFYSRRIGSLSPNSTAFEDRIDSNEIVYSTPSETSMINATKISGRTDNGLGIGVFNAMTSAAFGLVEDTIQSSRREVAYQSFTNYNMLVFDQNLPNNSSISFANTRMNSFQDEFIAQVSAVDFSLRNKASSYRLRGIGAMSQIYNKSLIPELGYKYFVAFEKTKGDFGFELFQNVESDTYNPNHMGFLRSNNEFTTGADLSYSIREPFWKLRNLNARMHINLGYLYNPREFTDFSIHWNLGTTFSKNYLNVGAFGYLKPVDGYDYFEPRVWGWYYTRPVSYEIGGWLSTDYRKTFAIDMVYAYNHVNSGEEQNTYFVKFEPRMRLNDKFLLIYKLENRRHYNNFGFTTIEEATNGDPIIYFGKRNQNMITNSVQLQYSFSNKLSLNFKLRHYWSKVIYNDFYTLEKNGSLNERNVDYNYFNDSQDLNFNIFNIDFNLSWHYAPGSVLSVVWKNLITPINDPSVQNYFDNLSYTMKSDQINSVSVKMIYYLDYQNVKKVFLKNKRVQ